MIPKILETLEPANVELPETCPHCGGKVQWDGVGPEIYCSNGLCCGKRLAKIVFFYTIAGAENMGEETIVKIFNAGYNSLHSILHITFKQLVEIDTIGDVTANIIIKNNKKILAGLDLPTLMQASDKFQGIGKVKAQQLIESFSPEMVEAMNNNQPLTQWRPTEAEYTELSKTLQSFWDGISQFNSFIDWNGLKISKPEQVDINTEGKCKGMAICFSGIRDPHMEQRIIAEGGKIASGVSKNTTHLIVKDVNANTTKIIKAKGFGIPILCIDEVDF